MNLSSSIQKMLLLLALSLAGCQQQKDVAPLPLETTASPEPHPGHLTVAPEFQQIGNSVDGGGILRVMIGTMAMLSTNEAEQERLAGLSLRPNLPSLPPPESVDLSAIGNWLTPGELPDAAQASQTRTFGAWKFLSWGEGLGETTVALYRSNVVQFAWQGYGMATTGAMQSKKPEDDSYTWFEGPPAGTDLDMDGVPDLLIYDYSGGAHCCFTVKHIVCSDPPVLTARISGWDSQPSYRDLDGDGRYEMIIGDASYAYWNACYAASPQPQVIFRIRQGHYEIAGDLMRSNAPTAVISETDIGKLHRQLSRYDQFVTRRQANQNEEVKLTAEEEADDDFFFGQAWRANGVCIPPVVWDLLLNLIYTGQIDSAVKALDTLWPASKGHKEEFANDLLDMIHGSWYGRHLPWFNELRLAFARSYPRPAAELEQYPSDVGTVASGKKIRLDYALTVDGKQACSTSGECPLVYMHGKNQLIPGLEQALTGMKPGETKQVIVKPEDGYGPSKPELIHEIEKTKIPVGQTLVKGMEVEVNHEGTPLPGTVSEVKTRTVVIDFNNPLAGKTLIYDVKIVAIGQTPATNDAIEPPTEKQR